MDNAPESSKAYRVRPGGMLRGTVPLPGDKSVSHRAVILAAIAEGTTRIEHFCPGTDCLFTLNALRALGASIEYSMEDAQVLVRGVGMRGLRASPEVLDLGNSGTGIRLLCGLLAGMGIQAELNGDRSLRRRPMQRIVAPLNAMGACVEAANDRPPLRIKGDLALRAMRHRSPIASAQLKSCLLLAGMYAEGETEVDAPASRDHTERLLVHFGCPVVRRGDALRIKGGVRLRAKDVAVPGDMSAAMFLLVGASIAPGSELLLRRVGVNPSRNGGIRILRAMGADISVISEDMLGEEPVADIRVRGVERLRAIDVPPDWVADAIDEFPVLFIAAACAEGLTHVRGIAELRVKESDRISTMTTALQTMGIEVDATDDSMSIQGGQLQGGRVQSGGDHRVAMACSIAALAASSDVLIDDCDNVLTSWPQFAAQLGNLGLMIEILDCDVASGS